MTTIMEDTVSVVGGQDWVFMLTKIHLQTKNVVGLFNESL